MTSSLLNNVSERYPYAPIQYHDTWIAVDPLIGCKARCSYCLLQLAGWTGVRPESAVPVPEVVNQLVNHKYFVPHKSVLCFGTRTDAFLQENVSHTLLFLEELEDRGLRNPIALLTKLRIPEAFVERVGAFRGVRPVFLISYSGLPAHLERGVPQTAALESLAALSAHGLPVIHYWRPIVRANSDGSTIQRVMDEVVPYSSASVYIGLKLNPHLRQVYAKVPELQLDNGNENAYGTLLDSAIETRLRSIAAARYPGYPLYKHTSCAVSYVLRKPDHTATFRRKEICLGSACPESQRGICAAAQRIPERCEVKALLAKIGCVSEFRVMPESVEVQAPLSQEDYCFLLHNLNHPIAAKVQFFRVFRGSIFDGVENASGSEGT